MGIFDSIGGAISDGVGWMGGAIGDAYDETLGRAFESNTPRMHLTKSELASYYRPDEASFDPRSNQRFEDIQDRAMSRTDSARRDQQRAAAQNQGSIRAPEAVAAFDPGAAPSFGGAAIGRSPHLEARVDQTRTNAALGAATDALGQDARSRRAQDSALAMTQAAAQGKGPSAGMVMAQQAGAQGAAMMRDAGAQASRAFGQANAGATGAYQDAAAQQAFATNEAGADAANQMRRGNQDALLAQASMASRARGGNMGAALLNAQNNAAVANQNTVDSAGSAQAAAGRQAAFNAAGAQRGAMNASVQANLQNAGALERANILAANNAFQGGLEGSRIRSAEQLSALSQAGALSSQMRGHDQSQAGVATNLANANLGADAQAMAGRQYNAAQEMTRQNANMNNDLARDRLNFDAQRDWTGMAQQGQQFSDKLNSGMAMQAALANQANRHQNVDRASQQEQFFTNQAAGMTSQEISAGMALEQMKSDGYNRGRDRMANYSSAQNAAASTEEQAASGNVMDMYSGLMNGAASAIMAGG